MCNSRDSAATWRKHANKELLRFERTSSVVQLITGNILSLCACRLVSVELVVVTELG